MLPELFDDLMHALPLPEYTSPKGVFNLAKYTPIGQVNAEISAKLYVSKRQLEKHKEFGPMQLSAEMSDSIYICTYTQAGRCTLLFAHDISSDVVQHLF